MVVPKGTQLACAELISESNQVDLEENGSPDSQVNRITQVKGLHEPVTTGDDLSNEQADQLAVVLSDYAEALAALAYCQVFELAKCLYISTSESLLSPKK
jgi:hypothetical protein